MSMNEKTIPVPLPRTTLDGAVPATNLTYANYKIKALLSSQSSGDGKTTSAVTIPGRKLLIDIDRRSESVAGFPGVHILRWEGRDPNSPEHWMWLEQVRKDLWALARTSAKEKKPFPWGGIVADGNTALFRVCMAWALTLDPKRGLGGSAAQQHYGPQMKNASDWIISLIGLPCHVIFTGHEDLVEGEGGQLDSYLPKVTGRLRTEISKWFNETYFCKKIIKPNDKGENRTRYFWFTDKIAKRDYLKSSMNQLTKYWNGPIEVDYGQEFHGFEDLLIRRFGNEAKEDILRQREVVGAMK